jgi:K+/H+ antiporter YhaU regulatory subunit KhtT
MVNKKLGELDIRGKFKVNIISVLRDENMNLTLVRPVIHATKLEILNG